MALDEAVDQLLKFCIVPDGMWPGSHYRHFAQEHIEKLRQLIDAGDPEEGAKPGDPGVAFGGLYYLFIIVYTHGAELIDAEGAVEQAIAAATKEPG